MCDHAQAYGGARGGLPGRRPASRPQPTRAGRSAANRTQPTSRQPTRTPRADPQSDDAARIEAATGSAPSRRPGSAPAVLPGAAGRVRRGAADPAGAAQPPLHPARHVPPLPGRGFAAKIDSPGAAPSDRALDLAAGLPGRRRPTWPGSGSRSGASTTSATPASCWSTRTVADDLVAVFRALYARALPDRGACGSPRLRPSSTPRPPATATTPASFVCRPTPGATYVLPARLRPRDRRQHVPEPLRQGRPGAPRAGQSPTSTATSSGPGMIAARRRRWSRRSRASAGSGAATGSALKDYQHFSQNGTLTSRYRR